MVTSQQVKEKPAEKASAGRQAGDLECCDDEAMATGVDDSEEAGVLELQGLAMAGLVGILRQLGDLAELAAEVLDGLQHQVMAVSERRRRLAVRAKQLMQQQPDDLLCQTQTMTRCRLNTRLEVSNHGGVVGDAPRFVVDHIKRCRGPPRLLSLLDRFDADGEGACLKRYTDPSFFRTHCSAKLHQASCGAPPLRPNPNGTMEPRPAEFQSCIHKYDPSTEAERRHSSETDIVSFIGSTQIYQGTTGQSKDSPTPNCCSDAGSDYVGGRSELERTSSFEAWLFPGPGFSADDGHETTQESSSPPTFSTMKQAKQDSAAAETSWKKGLSRRRRYSYKGSIEMIASRVISSLPGKLCMMQPYDPPLSVAADYCSRSHHAGGNGVAGVFLPLLVAAPVFTSLQDSVPGSQESRHQETNTRLQRTRCPSYDASVDAEIHDRQTGPSSISNPCSSSSNPEICRDPTHTPDSKDVLLPRMQRTGFDGSLHINEPENSCSEDTTTKVVDTPPLVPIPPMQWLSIKVPITYRKPFGEDDVQRAESKILTTTEPSELLVHSRAPDERPTEKVFYRANTMSDSEAKKHSNAARVDVQNSASGKGDEGNLQQHDENVFSSAMEELARMSPPWVPRPKHPLPEVASHDRVTLRNGPSPIHGSRSILDSRTLLLEQRKDTITGSPTNDWAATILQRADDMRRAHADSNDVDGEDNWRDDSD